MAYLSPSGYTQNKVVSDKLALNIFRHTTNVSSVRDLLKCVAIEKGRRLNPRDDPIHDQSTYLDGELRMRLYREYGVKGTFRNCVSAIFLR